jgi:poly(hydroxyalkanoate) depolymerase family esterase
MSRFRNSEFLRHFPKLPTLKGLQVSGFTNATSPSPLIETVGFGSNPGGLKMYSFVPADLPQKAALVVVLHGCTQTAAGYDVGAGWSTLAERYGFALLMPEQQSTNNANRCFSWFNPEDCTRDEGEACSIRQMIAQMAKDHSINRDRIFVTGLSAGGAMTSVMLATYPEVCAGGAIIAGLPFGAASNVEEALSGMRQSPSRAAGELGDMVRQASSHKGPWPKVSVWHGGLDLTVNPSNASAIVEQWLDVHGLPSAPMSQTKVDGHDRAIWWNTDGETVVEFYHIPYMSHGTPLGVGESKEYFGNAGPFLIDAGISSSYHIATFFGLTERIHRAKSATDSVASDTIKAAVVPELRAESFDQLRKLSKVDVGAIIAKALTAAGLMK